MGSCPVSVGSNTEAVGPFALSNEFDVVAWDAPGCGGSEDPQVDFGMAGYADAAAIPGAELVTLPGVGHSINLEAPGGIHCRGSTVCPAASYD